MQCERCSYDPTLSEMQASPAACPKCGGRYDAEGKAKHNNFSGRPGLFKPRVFVFAVLIIICISAAGFLGLYAYKEKLVSDQVGKEIKLSSAYVTQVLTALDDGGSITYTEFFSKAGKAIEEIDSIAVRLSVIEPQNKTTDSGIFYTKKAQEVLRGRVSTMRAILSLSSAKEREKAAELRKASENEYIRASGYEEIKRSLDDQIKALDELKGASTLLADSAKELKEAGERIEGIDSSYLVPPNILDKLINFKK